MATLGGNLLQRTRCAYFRGGEPFACNKRKPGSGCAASEGIDRGHALLGGSDACIAVYPGDWAIALVAFDAKVDVLGPDGQRTIPVEELHREPGATPDIETTLEPDELILRIRVPETRAGPRLDLSQDPRPGVLRLRARLGGGGPARWRATPCATRASPSAASPPGPGAPARPSRHWSAGR